jgi:hypothetical protein
MLSDPVAHRRATGDARTAYNIAAMIQLGKSAA